MMSDKKRALVIGASEEAEYAIKSAQQRGYYVAAVDGNPDAKGLVFADMSIITDIRDKECLKESIEAFQPQVVLPVPIGRYLTATGVVNDEYGLKGVSEKSAQLCTDKYEFHQLLHQHGLRDGNCLLLPAGESRQSAVEKSAEYLRYSDYPNIILKPRYGSGSRGVAMVSVGDDIADYFTSSSVLDEDLIIEPAYPGSEYGADGIICNGELSLVLLREKIISEAPYRQAVAYMANHVGEWQSEIARSYLQRIVSVLGFEDCIIHCDLMWSGSDFKVIEISARPSGHNLHNLFVPIATGVNMIDCFIDICEGHGAESIRVNNSDKVFLIGYFDHQEGMLLSVPSSKDILAEFESKMIVCNISMQPGFVERTKEGHGLMSRGYFVISGDSREDVLSTRGAVLDFVFADFAKE